MRALIIAALMLAVGGCFTYRDKVAYKRAEIVLTAWGNQGDALSAACAKEVREANIDTGADKVALAPTDITPEKAEANSAAIKAARETRQEVIAAGRGLLESAPLGGAILAALGTAGALWLRLRRYRQAAETIVEGVGKAANQPTKEAIGTLAVDAGIQPFVDALVQRIDPPKEV